MKFRKAEIERWNTYFDNAVSKRDFRVQFRGARAPLMFGAYIAILSTTALLFYNQTASIGYGDPYTIQSALRNFQQVVLSTLGLLLCFVSPALSATSVVLERQRQSLDLVLCAPIRPRYYLVGKLISAYRTVWMLLVLSLPITAMTILIGGASWIDIMVQYALLSVQGLVLTSIAVLVSSMVKKPIAAVIISYVGVIAYLASTGIAAALNSVSPMVDRASGLNFFVALNPFTILDGATSLSTIFGIAVPNALLGAMASFAVVRLNLLAAGSALETSDRRLARRLRIEGLVSLGVLAALLESMVMHLLENSQSANMVWTTTQALLGLLAIPMLLWVPLFSAYSDDGEVRQRWNGIFKIREIFRTTPAGALPYLLSLVGAISAGLAVGCYSVSRSIPYELGPQTLHLAGLVTFFWSLGRFTSSLKMGIAAARVLQFTAFAAIAIIPTPFVASLTNAQTEGQPLWNLCMLRPFFTGDGQAFSSGLAMAMAFAMLVASAGIAMISERIRGRKGSSSSVASSEVLETESKTGTSAIAEEPEYVHVRA